MQFVLIKAPSHPPDKGHRRVVHSHVMRKFHSHRRKLQTLQVRKRVILQKGLDTSSTPFSPLDKIINKSHAKATAPNPQVRLSDKSQAATEAIVSLLSPSSDAPESPSLILHNQRGASPTNERVVTPLNRAASERDSHAGANYGNLLGYLSQFDRWLFDTSKYPLRRFFPPGKKLTC